jgi:hypothetical protein
VEAISLKHLGQSNYKMSLPQDKALTAWTSVAVPAGIPVTWEMFKQTMLTNFAHPDRQHRTFS